MLKRILFDAYLLKTQFPELQFALVQLESQLGGDYAQLSIKPHGSKSSHTLMSYRETVDLKNNHFVGRREKGGLSDS